MRKKTKLEQMKQTDGKVDTFKPTTLDQILGDRGSARYGTTDVNTYINQLSAMTKTDIQSHAIKMGIAPIDDMERLKKRLVKEFNLYVSAYQHQTVKNTVTQVSPEIAKILAEGR